MNKKASKHSLFPALLGYLAILLCVLSLVYFFPSLTGLLTRPQKVYSLRTTSDLQALLSEHNISLNEDDILTLSGQLSAVNLPEDLAHYPAEKRSKLFVSFLLPHIASCNARILQQRKKLLQYREAERQGRYLSSEMKAWFNSLAMQYRVNSADPDTLLTRVDIIPPSLALAQAINESGWGTSRFARYGNALYGQHLADGSAEKHITSLYGNVKVAAFDSLSASTWSYMHNLNTSRAYKQLRSLRAQLRSTKGELRGSKLVRGLLLYSELGEKYIEDLRLLIKKYNLERFDASALPSARDPLLIRFSRPGLTVSLDG